MADLYVSAAGSNTSPYDTWAKAANVIQTALTAASPGDDVWVIDTHSETFSANTTITSGGTVDSPVRVIAATGTGKVYSTTKPIFDQTTPTSHYFYIDCNAEWYGFHWGPARTISLTLSGAREAYYEDCLFQLSTNTGERIQPRGSYSKAVVRDCEFRFGQVAQHLSAYAQTILHVIDCSLHASSSAVNNIFQQDSGSGLTAVFVDGGDYTGAATTANLFGDVSSSNRPVLQYAQGVLLPSSGAITAVVDQMGTRVEAFSCGPGDNLQSFEAADLRGKALDSTSVYRTAAKSIYDQGSSHYSVQVTPTASCTYGLPFRVAIWQQWVAANQTLTVELFYDSATSLTDANCWIEVDYPDATNLAQRRRADTRAATVATAGTNLTASSLGAADWTGESGSNQNFQKIAHTVSGGGAGMHRVFFCMGTKATTPTVYVCPDVEVT